MDPEGGVMAQAAAPQYNLHDEVDVILKIKTFVPLEFEATIAPPSTE